MAKNKAEEEEDEDEGGGGGKKKLIMIVGVLAAAGAVYNFVLKSPPEEEMAEEEMAEVEPVEGEIVQMEEMILNVGVGENEAYLRIGLALVLEEGVLAADFEPELPIAKDVAVQYLSALSPDDLRSPGGKEAAKDELSELVREAYGGEKVVRVLFTSLVMQ